MNRPIIYQLRIEWFKPVPGKTFDEKQVDSINRYARSEEHAKGIGRKYAREVLKATGEFTVTVIPISERAEILP